MAFANLSSQQSQLPAQDQTSQSSSMDEGGGVGGKRGSHGLHSRQLMAAGKVRVIFLSEWGLW